MSKASVVYAPQPGPQRALVASTVYELLFGGSKGGSKTMGLVMLNTRWVHLPRFRALILRREAKDLSDIVDKTQLVYKSCFKCRFVQSHQLYPPHWRFLPQGSLIALSHCQHEEDWEKYEGQEYQIINFDELTQFSEKQYKRIIQRCRGVVPGLPQHVRYIRASATASGGRHKKWVFKHWQPWLDPTFEHHMLAPRLHPLTRKPLPPAASGQVLWYKRNSHDEDEIVPPHTKGARTRSFIQARLSDNKILEQADPNYRVTLENLNLVERAQALDGDWTIRESRGMMFPRDRWRVRTAPPSRVLLYVRFWDYACSDDGDYASGTKIGLCENGEIWIDHSVRRRGLPGDIDTLMLETAQQDGRKVLIRCEQEPGSMAKRTMTEFVKLLRGFDFVGETSTGSKIERARPLSSQQNHYNVYVREAAWNGEFFDEFEDFPEKKSASGEKTHDDQVDSASGAFHWICQYSDVDMLLKLGEEMLRDQRRLSRAFDQAGIRGIRGL